MRGGAAKRERDENWKYMGICRGPRRGGRGPQAARRRRACGRQSASAAEPPGLRPRPAPCRDRNRSEKERGRNGDSEHCIGGAADPAECREHSEDLRGDGARLHLVEPMAFTIDDTKLKRAGLDYWKYLDVTTYPSLENFMERHKDEQEKMYYFTTKAQHIYTEVQYPDGCWLLFGREDAGLPEELLVQHPARCLRFPMRQGLRSLNLSNSVAIGVYEALRQWDFPQLQNEGQLHRLKWE